MTRERAILFDWDGTLVDTGDVLLSCWHQMTERVLGYPFPVTETDRRKYLAMRASESFPTLSDDPEVVKQLFVEFDLAYAAKAPEHVRAQAGAADLIAHLRSFAKVGVVTSKTAVRFHIDAAATGLAGTFDILITGDDVAKGKPDPEGIRSALETLGCAASASWYIGDGPVDIRAGRAAGVRTIGISHGLHSVEELADEHPDALVSSLAEARQILDRGTAS
jgi:HAD superfamily hydrolase (TIGR01509 family)